MTESSRPGSVRIAGYEIEGFLGRGGTSQVYAARHEALDRRVALKVFSVSDRSSQNAVSRLSREAKVLARLDHDNVVRCFDFGEQGRTFYLVLEHVDGESLKDRLDRVGQLDEAVAIDVAIGVARGLGHAHAHGVIHRDVKPGNVLLSRDGRVKLTDFGLARADEGLNLTRSGTMVGTPQYLSPEQAKNPRQADERSDLYSLGATLYHMVTGVTPHAGETLTEVISHIVFSRVLPPETHRPDLNRALSRIIARLMARDPRMRYRDAGEAIGDLERVRSGEFESLPGISWERAAGPSPERRFPAWLPYAGLGVLILAAGIATLRLRGSMPAESNDADVAPSTEPFSAADLRSGRVSARDAWSRLGEEPLASPFAAAVIEEVERRAALIAVRAASSARRAVATGDFESAVEAFDSTVRATLLPEFGAARDDLPSELRDAVDGITSVERQRVEQELVSGVRRAADGAIALDLDRLLADLQVRLEGRDYRGIEAQIDDVARDIDARVLRCFVEGVQTIVPEAREPAPSDAWFATALQSYGSALKRIRLLRVERPIEGARALALGAIETAAAEEDLDAATKEQIRGRLQATVEDALGVGLDEFPGEPGPITRALEEKAELLDQERMELERLRRLEIEARLRPALEDAYRARDVAAARRVAAELGAEVEDPWLALLVKGVDSFERLERAVWDAFDHDVGRKTGVRVRGILRQGVLRAVERGDRRLVFGSPAFNVDFAEIEPSEWVRLAGPLAPPLASALVLHFGDDGAGLALLAQRTEGEPEASSAIAPVLAQRNREQLNEASGREDRARAELEAFDRVLALGRADEYGRIADRILHDPDLRRVDVVAPRLAELRRARDKAARIEKVEARRAVVRRESAATVSFLPGDVVEFAYSFDTSRELDDFRLPGPEWAIRSGRLTSVPSTTKAGRADDFVNRPGVERVLPFDPNEPARVSFELDCPYEQPEPALVGLRIFSICFVIRSFGEEGGGGQVNAWSGDLDDFRGYVYEPAIGETKPAKRGAGPVREFTLKRGERYRVEVEWTPGTPSECLLKVDGDVVYRLRTADKPRKTTLEIRSKTPISLDDVRLRGVVAGTDLP